MSDVNPDGIPNMPDLEPKDVVSAAWDAAIDIARQFTAGEITEDEFGRRTDLAHLAAAEALFSSIPPITFVRPEVRPEDQPGPVA